MSPLKVSHQGGREKMRDLILSLNKKQSSEEIFNNSVNIESEERMFQIHAEQESVLSPLNKSSAIFPMKEDNEKILEAPLPSTDEEEEIFDLEIWKESLKIFLKKNEIAQPSGNQRTEPELSFIPKPEEELFGIGLRLRNILEAVLIKQPDKKILIHSQGDLEVPVRARFSAGFRANKLGCVS